MGKNLMDVIHNDKIDMKKLNNWVLISMIEKIKNAVYMKTLDDLRKRHREPISGIKIYPDSVQLTEESKEYQSEFIKLMANNFEVIMDKIIYQTNNPMYQIK